MNHNQQQQNQQSPHMPLGLQLQIDDELIEAVISSMNRNNSNNMEESHSSSSLIPSPHMAANAATSYHANISSSTAVRATAFTNTPLYGPTLQQQQQQQSITTTITSDVIPTSKSSPLPSFSNNIASSPPSASSSSLTFVNYNPIEKHDKNQKVLVPYVNPHPKRSKNEHEQFMHNFKLK
jgi:cytoskeletal protein RodZ